MSNEILSRDQNHVTVLGGITDDSNQFVTMLRVDPTTKRLLISATGSGSGSVTSVSVVSANGFAGTVADPTTTPAITISTSITGILLGDGTGVTGLSSTGTGDVVRATSPTLVTPILGVASATSLTLPVSSSGLLIYNTADQVTNFELFTASWIANVITLQPTAGGTGTVRNMAVGQSSNGASTAIRGGFASITLANTSPHIAFSRALSNSATLVSISYTGTQSSGSNTCISITPTYNQSGTAANSDLFINRTETALGSGANLLIDAQVATVSKFSVSNTGNIINAGTIASTGAITSGGVAVPTISSTDTLSNKTLTAPKIANAGFIADANGNELIIFTTTASAVNEITIANGSTGNNATVTASGETNTGITITGKGTKGVAIGNAFSNKLVALSDGATPALDASLGNVFYLDAAGNRTIAVPSNATSGQKIVIRHFANGAARTLALNTGAGGFRFGTDITALTETGSGLMDYIGCIWNEVDSFWDVVAYIKGF